MINLAYIVASILFIIGLKMMSKADTARKGNGISGVGMLLAIVATLLQAGLSYTWISVGLVAGSALGAVMAYRVKMTGMPEMVGLFNGLGGLASLFVGWASYINPGEAKLTLGFMIPTVLAVVIGGVTFTGSLVAYLKLSEKIEGKAKIYPGQKFISFALIGAALVAAWWICTHPDSSKAWDPSMMVLIAVSFVMGVLAVMPIGGADMPVVISLLNSYSGMAACAAGFIIQNTVLIVSGALVGASGIILTSIMCKAMNRSLPNVLFSGFQSAGAKSAVTEFKGEARPISVADTYMLLESASSVVFVPGYGMAVAQAQHAVEELGELLEANGCEVRYCIHPVAGRMPGHMNVLLAEADVAYEQLVEPGDVNPTMANVDVAVVIGATDVVNPAARTEKASPLYGMPIIDVDLAKTCIVLKRSLKAGYAGVDNPLFFASNTRMLLGDAKQTVQGLVAEFKAK